MKFKKDLPFEERAKNFRDGVVKLAKKHGVAMMPNIQITNVLPQPEEKAD